MGDDTRYSTVRSEGREHFPQTPRGFIAIRIVQLILAIACLGLDAYVLSNLLFDGAELSIFVSLATMVACIYYLVVEFGKDAWKGYNYWAVLALDIFLLIFWLISFALDADRVAPFANGWTICDDFECVYYPLEDYIEFFACMCTVVGLAGVEFVLFIVSLSIHAVAMHRHRAAGLQCKAVSTYDRENGNTAATTTMNNTSTANNTIPLQEKHDNTHTHVAPAAAPSYSPTSQSQHPHQQHSQSIYAASSVSPDHTNTSPYQPPPPPQQQPTGTGYYEVQPPQQGGGSYPTTTHHQASFSGSGNVMGASAPLPGHYEAPGSPGTYA